MNPAFQAGRRLKGSPDVLALTDEAYLAAIRRFPLRPIRDNAELDAASAIVDERVDRDDLSPAESD